jgi:hypothetical protein
MTKSYLQVEKKPKEGLLGSAFGIAIGSLNEQLRSRSILDMTSEGMPLLEDTTMYAHFQHWNKFLSAKLI